uniref:Uncharacterized protein n=1 Tax=Knipowitschia caucasica TaxID=637954 RepID=A0AAV2LMQ7_KNICA
MRFDDSEGQGVLQEAGGSINEPCVISSPLTTHEKHKGSSGHDDGLPGLSSTASVMAHVGWDCGVQSSVAGFAVYAGWCPRMASS